MSDYYKLPRIPPHIAAEAVERLRHVDREVQRELAQFSPSSARRVIRKRQIVQRAEPISGAIMLTSLITALGVPAAAASCIGGMIASDAMLVAKS